MIKSLSRDKALALLAATSLIAALAVILATPAADGYEISIYDAYPTYLWFLIGLSLAVGIWILVRQAFAEERSNLWVVGFALVLLVSSVVLLLPLFRGYPAYGRFDQMFQVGLVRDIQLTGHFGAPKSPGENFYPVTHVLIASIGYVTGLDPKLLLMVVPALFFLFYAVSIYLLSREMTQSRAQCLMVTAFGSLPLFSWLQGMFIPSLLTFFLLPLLLFVYYRAKGTGSRRFEFTLIFVLLILMMPFSHPANGGVFLVVVFLCLWIAHRMIQWRWRSPVDNADADPIALGWSFLNPIAIVLTVWFLWFSSFRVFDLTVQEGVKLIVYGQSPFAQHLGSLERAGAPIYDVVQTFLLSYGPLILYCAAAGAIGVPVWARLVLSKERTDPNNVGFSLVLMCFAVLAFLVSLGFLSGGTTNAQSRYLPYVLLGSALLNGRGLLTLLQGRRLKRLTMPIATVILVASGVMGIFNLHMSPLIKAANQQITTMDLEGSEWFFDHQSEAFLIDQIAFNQHTYASALFGASAVPRNVRAEATEREQPPEHFRADWHQTYGEAYTQDRYFVNDRLSRIWYPEGLGQRYEALWKWTPADFEALEGDPTVSRVYSNGEFEVFYIRAAKPSAAVGAP